MFIIIWLIFAYICYMVAEEKGLNQFFCGIMGIIFGVFALAIVCIIPNKNK